MDTLREACTVMVLCRAVLLRMRNVSGKSCTANQNTYFVVNDVISEIRSFYEIMWEKYGRTEQATDRSMVRRMRFACWMTKATNTL
jgi:hypothetical protein